MRKNHIFSYFIKELQFVSVIEMQSVSLPKPKEVKIISKKKGKIAKDTSTSQICMFKLCHCKSNSTNFLYI